jgi:hypothetical protein
MGSLKRTHREFEERLSRAVPVLRPDEVFNRVMVQGAVDIVFKPNCEPGISIVAERASDFAQVTFHFIKDTIFIDDRRQQSADVVGSLMKPANLLKRLLRRFGFGSCSQLGRNAPVLVCISQGGVPDLSHMGTGTVLMENINQYGLVIRTEGETNLLASGEVFSLAAEIEGTGNWDLEGLQATKAYLSISGSGSIHASASEIVKNEISGAGTITVEGNPMQRSEAISGAGRVEYV